MVRRRLRDLRRLAPSVRPSQTEPLLRLNLEARSKALMEEKRDQVLEIIRKKPPEMHLVLTGRDAHPKVIELSDTASEVLEVKHAYQKGIEPQPGIDY